jgi:formylmethanofuran dehydrogenase subunit E
MAIRSYTFDEYTEKVRSFHGFAAPGVLLGKFIVEMAYSGLPEGVLFDAISETDTCLPDAVQMLTSCTVGNGWLKVMDTGRFALVLYDKVSGDGVRVCVNASKAEQWPEIKSWFFGLKSKKEQDYDLLVKQIRDGGAAICDIRRVKVDVGLFKKAKEVYGICPECKESYPVSDGARCRGCTGSLPYQFA